MLVFTFIESSAFERVRSVYLDDDEYANVQQFMMLALYAKTLIRVAELHPEILREMVA